MTRRGPLGDSVGMLVARVRRHAWVGGRLTLPTRRAVRVLASMILLAAFSQTHVAEVCYKLSVVVDDHGDVRGALIKLRPTTSSNPRTLANRLHGGDFRQEIG